MGVAADPRLILREDELDAALELLFLAESALWSSADVALEAEAGLGRSHYRMMFLLKRRPGVGVRELSRLTALSKQGASRTLGELERMGLAVKAAGDVDARRRPAELTDRGVEIEQRVSERLRSQIARAFRAGGPEAAAGARRILAALAGGRLAIGRPEED